MTWILSELVGRLLDEQRVLGHQRAFARPLLGVDLRGPCGGISLSQLRRASASPLKLQMRRAWAGIFGRLTQATRFRLDLQLALLDLALLEGRHRCSYFFLHMAAMTCSRAAASAATSRTCTGLASAQFPSLVFQLQRVAPHFPEAAPRPAGCPSAVLGGQICRSGGFAAWRHRPPGECAQFGFNDLRAISRLDEDFTHR